MRQAVCLFLTAVSIMGAALSVHVGASAETADVADGANKANEGANVDAAVLQQGKEIFLTKAVPACAICHTLADAGSEGAIGPDLDEIKPDATMVKKALYEGLGVMPNFSELLSEDEINAVAAYVAHAVGN